MPTVEKSKLPQFVRRCYDQARKANEKNRQAEKERLNFYIGGEGQWRPEEVSKRKAQGRPLLSINRCKPAVDQIEGDVRLNPPGPQVHPVGGGADKDDADIIAGLIREVEYRSNGRTAYATAAKYVAASGCAYLELVTEYTSDRSFDQRLCIYSIEDPSTVFFDPTSRMANRQDAQWAGKLKLYGREEYAALFGKDRIALKDKLSQRAMGWIGDAMGINTDFAMVDEWTGAGKGPFYVCEFYMVEYEPARLRMFSDMVARFDDEPVPLDVTPTGEERKIQRRKIKKYVVDAFEVLDETEWLGNLIPLFPVLGPEVYIDGQLHRLSLIEGAIDSNRALNYAATSAVEIAGNMPRAPWIGPKGSFDDPRWQTANSTNWATLEYTPVMVTDPTTGQSTMAPPPQRNLFEVSIQWLLALGAWFSDSIKATTGIFDASLGANKGDQSGRAIEQLRSESNVGNYSYADNLHRAIEVMYGEMCVIFPKILSGPQVVTIVKPDGQHETARINQLFPAGQEGKPNNITIGEYSCRVKVGPDFDTRQEQSIPILIDFFKGAPQALQAPGVAASFLRLLGEGNPKIEQMANLLDPKSAEGADDPAMLQQQAMQLQQQNQALTVIVQKLQQELQAKLPEIEAKKWQTAVDALTKITVAEINASKDTDKQNAQILANQMEQMLGMSHEQAMSAVNQNHEQSMAQMQHEQAESAEKEAAEEKATNA